MTMNDNISPIELIEIALSKNISIKDLLILYTISTDNISTYLKLVNKGIVTQKNLIDLVKDGYLINTSLTSLPVITKKTIELFTNINFERNVSKISDIVNVDSIRLELERDDVEKWIDEYRHLFRGKKAGAMGDKNLCIARMKEFVNENPQYTKQHILAATKKYIEDQASQSYKYLKFAHYFIQKTEVIEGKKVSISKLQTYCDELHTTTTNSIIDNKWHGGLKIG